MKAKRYSICKFPSLYGTPVSTDRYWLAVLIAWCRSLSGVLEVRVIDRETGEHRLVL